MMKNVLFFSDFGVDDFVAIIYAYFNKDINIVGVVADYGNVSKDDAVRNAAYLREVTGVATPIFGGAHIPLTGEFPTYYPEVHGVEGLGPIIPTTEVSAVFENFDGIKKIIEKYKDDLSIVNVGRLSSLATAFILYPTYMEEVSEYYIMGGAFQVPGNITAVAEANIYGDPYAANIVLNMAPKSVKIFPLDVTRSALVSPMIIDDLDEFYQQTNNHVGKLVKPMVDYYYQFYKKNDPTISGSPLHDLFTLWATVNEKEISYSRVPVKIVVNQGCAFGQTIADFRKTIEKADYPYHEVALHYNYPTFIRSFYQTMKKGSS
jgi:purine nucleosidase